MIYRLWEAAKKRPNRAAGIFGLATILGAVIHHAITVISFLKAIAAPTSLGSVYEGQVARAVTIANVSIWFDAALLLTGAILLGVYLWRAWHAKS